MNLKKFTKVKFPYFSIYCLIAINNTLIIKRKWIFLWRCYGMIMFKCLFKGKLFQMKENGTKIHVPLSWYDLQCLPKPEIKWHSLDMQENKHNLHLLCQFIFCKLSKMVKLELSRTHFNLGFNFFFQKHFARENKSSNISCSDLQLGTLSLYAPD